MCLGQGKLLTVDFLLSLWAETFQEPPLLSGSTYSISQDRDQLGLERNRWENWPFSIPLDSTLKCTSLSLHIRIIGDAQGKLWGSQPSSLWRVKNLKEFHQSSACWVHIALVCPPSLPPSFPFWDLASYPLWICPKYFCASVKIITKDFINHKVQVHRNGSQLSEILLTTTHDLEHVAALSSGKREKHILMLWFFKLGFHATQASLVLAL